MVKRGKVAVVGPRHIEEKIMPAFERKFSTAVFFSVEEIRLKRGRPSEPSNYFVKVTQDDGEMAWSSPVFVDS